MTSARNSQQTVACFRFTRLLGVSLFSILRVSDETIGALIAWPEDYRGALPLVEDLQEILWTFDHTEELSDALAVGEFAYDAGCIQGDRIAIREVDLSRGLLWDEERVRRGLSKLLSLRVWMIDDGTKTDFLYLHF